MSGIVRNIDAEIELQNALDRGDRVWVIGDVHGHSDALENLIAEINPNPGDRMLLSFSVIFRSPSCRALVPPQVRFAAAPQGNDAKESAV